MDEVPRLLDLCLLAIRDEFLQEDDCKDILSAIYGLPSELFNSLLPHLPPLALQKLHENLPLDFGDEFELANDYGGDCRKRKRNGILDGAWRALYNVRWPVCGRKNHVDVWLNKQDEVKHDRFDDWHQLYWQTHLQDCIDAVAETAMLPSYVGTLGEIQIPGAILGHIGYRGQLIKLTHDYLKFFYHCQHFGIYARYLRLPNALCVVETCKLLKSSKLVRLELQWIKSNDHVDGLCKLLNQNSETLKSIEFIHCKLSPTFVNAICNSLHLEGLQTHGIEDFSIKRSSFLQSDSSIIPVGLKSFLIHGRSLESLTLSDNHLGRNFARVIFNSLLDASASISILDLSENNISGFASQFRWKTSDDLLGIGSSLQSLRVLNLRCCSLVREDTVCLKQALFHMPNLQNLDLSDNSIEDGLRSLLPYFTAICGRDLPFIELKLDNCELRCTDMIQLFGVLSTLKTSLKVLSIKGNSLGSNIGVHLGKFMCAGVSFLDIEDIGLGPLGFQQALNEITEGLKLVYINISNNHGGIEAAKYVSRLISHAHEIVAIDARYNSMPVDSLSVISSGLKSSKGKLEHLDLGGNSFCDKHADVARILPELGINRECVLNLILSTAPNVPVDNDP